MRNSGPGHYGEVLFNMNRAPCLSILDNADLKHTDWPESSNVRLFGKAIRNFGKCQLCGSLHYDPVSAFARNRVGLLQHCTVGVRFNI